MDASAENKAFYEAASTARRSRYRDIADHPASLAAIERTLRRHTTKPLRGARWLDVGCGLGWLADVAQRNGMSFEGIDVSEANVAACRAQRRGIFHVGDFTTATLSPPYDLVSFISTLHHFDDWRAAVDRALALLRPGGLLYVEHEPTRWYARFYRKWLPLRDPAWRELYAVEVHWLQRPSILPEELPEGIVEYHADFVPVVRRARIGGRSQQLQRVMPSYRKLVRSPGRQ
jgi:SAM-dependent methyltransferase